MRSSFFEPNKTYVHLCIPSETRRVLPLFSLDEDKQADKVAEVDDSLETLCKEKGPSVVGGVSKEGPYAHVGLETRVVGNSTKDIIAKLKRNEVAMGNLSDPLVSHARIVVRKIKTPGCRVGATQLFYRTRKKDIDREQTREILQTLNETNGDTAPALDPQLQAVAEEAADLSSELPEGEELLSAERGKWLLKWQSEAYAKVGVFLWRTNNPEDIGIFGRVADTDADLWGVAAIKIDDKEEGEDEWIIAASLAWTDTAKGDDAS